MVAERVDDTLYLNTLANQQSREKTYFLHLFYYSRAHMLVLLMRVGSDMSNGHNNKKWDVLFIIFAYHVN